MKFPHYTQASMMDCGPTCLRMIAKYYGKNISNNKLSALSEIGKDGVNLYGLSDAAEKIGLRTLSVEISFEKLINEAPLPCIIHWNQNHFVVVAPQSTSKKIVVADPSSSIVTYKKEEFLAKWLNTSDNIDGVALLMEKTPAFDDIEESNKGISWQYLFQYLSLHSNLIWKLVFALLIGSLLQLIFPYITQSVVDIGINTKNINFIYVVLIAQTFLFIGKTFTDFIRSRILLHIGTKINIAILSDFWAKLMRLPVSFFDLTKTGDILQRIGDHNRIQNFLTTTVLNVLFSALNLVVFSIVLFLYKANIFFIFITGTVCYILWIRLFLTRRRNLDVKRFYIAAKENSATMQLIGGMQDIKLNNCEKSKRWEWERLQTRLFKLSFSNLSLSQYQQSGAVFINESKNILITLTVATAVINGELTLGVMLAIQYMVGQLNSPVEQLIAFVQQAQDAKISLERLNEIHELEDEESPQQSFITHLPANKTINIKNLSFTYTGAGNDPVLKNLSFTIPEGKVTAIVGMSGSGKTTLIKLLLKFYNHSTGDIKINETMLKDISPKIWRNHVSCVMQEGYIFNDTIANNIALSDENPDLQRILNACELANITSFIDTLPKGLNTKIGLEGNGISQGQKQRILIARAIYKNPDYLFLDEATNSLDANNEKVIIENLQRFFVGKTVVVVAHRLSTVKNADNIIVLNHGELIEEGTHDDLSKKRGHYYELVKNQLELGN
jgi:ATP-binding cassette subfamily B protein